MVDLVARIISEDDKRVISFKTSEVIFGGGRLNLSVNEIPCEYEELMKVYDEANSGTVAKSNSKKVDTTNRENNEEKTSDNDGGCVSDDPVEEVATAEPVAVETPEQPVRRTRKKKIEIDNTDELKVVAEDTTPNTVKTVVVDMSVEPVETPSEQPVRRTRKKRTEE